MTDRRALAILAAIHLAMVALVVPRGDFPLNDDWAYAQSVAWLLAEGRIRLSDWVGMNLVPQTMLGAAGVSLLGAGFESLRHVTQAVALAAMAAAYAWFRSVRLDSRTSLVATLAIVSFPAWPVLANSFMTDLYGFALLFAAAALFVRSIGATAPRFPVAATLLCAAAVLQRQVALAIAFSYMAAALWSMRPPTARAAARAVGPFAIVCGAEWAFHAYLAAGPGVPEGQQMLHGRVLPRMLAMLTNEDRLAEFVASNAFTMTGYLGVFASGWFAWWGMPGANRATRWGVIAGGAAIAVVALCIDWLPPYRAGNVIDAAGIGPFILHDAVRGVAALDRSPGIFWRVVAIPAAFAAAALVATAATACARVVRAGRDADPVQVFLIVAIVAYLGPFVVTDYFDRYLLYALPLVFALWARTWPEGGLARSRHLGLAWMAVALVLASLATRDYFSWNRARWDSLRDLEASGITADAIDGGFEYNALRRFDIVAHAQTPGKSWYWVKDDRYVVAFGPVPGYHELRVTPVPHWLPRSPGRIVILERNR